MGNDDYGFLGERQRKVIDRAYETRGAVPSDEKSQQAKKRLKQEAATPGVVCDVLDDIIHDLRRIEAYYLFVLEQPGGRHFFYEHLLPALITEINMLQSLADDWANAASRYTEPSESNANQLTTQLEPVVNDTLYRDLEYYPIRPDEFSSNINPESFDDINNNDLSPQYEEVRKRRNAVMELLYDEELFEILDFIATTKQTSYPDRKKGGHPWAWWASRVLDTELGVVQEGTWIHEVTDRGAAVHAAIKSLRDCPPVVTFADRNEVGTTAATLYLLENYLQYTKR